MDVYVLSCASVKAFVGKGKIVELKKSETVCFVKNLCCVKLPFSNILHTLDPQRVGRK